ncbi:MAG: hypothetical protein ACE5EO_00420 [Candidatus Krumholzibacteriia bacterium]
MARFVPDPHASLGVGGSLPTRVRAAMTVTAALVACAAGWAAGPPAVAGVGRAAGPAAGGIHIDTRVTADSVTVGERLHVRYRASYPESLVLLPPESFDTGTCRLVSLAWRNDKEKGRRVKEARLTVMAVDLEAARVPEAAFHFLTPGGDTLVAYGEEVFVPVREMTGERDVPQPLKPQWRAPRSYFYFYVAAAALVLATLAVYLLRRRRRPARGAPPEPEIPADIAAMEALARIEKMQLLEAGEFKRYYTLVVDAVRHYLERRFGVLAMDRTTSEILSDLDIVRVHVDDLEPLLQEADLVKFAKFEPDAVAGRTAMDRAREIIVQTAVAPQAAEPAVYPNAGIAESDPGKSAGPPRHE